MPKSILRNATTTAIAAALLCTLSPAHAAVKADAKQIAGILQDIGYRAEIKKDDDGEYFITSSTGGVKFIILMMNCSPKNTCATIQYYAGFSFKNDADFKKMNEWNKTSRFGRAYIDEEGDPVIEMDVDLDDGGMSVELFKDNLEFWETVVGKFSNYIKKDND